MPKNAPPDQRIAMLAIGGAYQPAPSMAQRLRDMVAAARKTSRREFNVALAFGWGILAFVGLTFGAMFQDFFGPKVLREPTPGTPSARYNQSVRESTCPDRVIRTVPLGRSSP